MFKKTGFLIIFLLLMLGCATPVPYPKDYSLQKSILLPFKITDIEIADLRSDTTSSTLDLPLLASRPKEWKIQPALSEALKREINSMIVASSNEDGIPARLKLTIIDGYYMISGDAWKVGEHTFFECELTYHYQSTTSDRSWKISTNEYNDYVGVFNATEKHVRESYRINVRNCLFKALRKSEEIFEANH